MKKTILITALLLIVTLVFTGCKSKEERAMEEMGRQFEKMSEVQEKLMRGEITEEEAERMIQEMVPAEGAVPQRDMPKGLPRWAKNLGLSEPKGMELDQPNSYETSTNNPNETFDSIDLVYRGDFEIARREAERIAEEADMPMIKLFGMLVDYEDLVQYGNGIGDAYSEDLEYTIIIEASIEEGEGRLEINALNQKQMAASAEQLQKMMEGMQ